MDAIYISVDFHARQQTICYLKTETGELVIVELKHEDKEQVRAFYQQFQERDDGPCRGPKERKRVRHDLFLGAKVDVPPHQLCRKPNILATHAHCQ